MLEDFYKAMSSQDIKVKCIKEDNEYDFRAGEEYDATYFPPSIFGSHHSSFCVSNKSFSFRIIHFTWEEFYEHFEVLTEGFEGVPYIEFEFK